MSFSSKPLKLLTRLIFPKHHSHTTFNNNNIVTSISNSFRTKHNWDTITKRFTSIKLTPSLVEQILLQLNNQTDAKNALSFFHWSTKTHRFQHTLERMLNVLASYSLLNCSIRTNEDGKRERVFGLSSIGQFFAYDKDGGSLGPLSTLVHRGYNGVWDDVKDAIINPSNNDHFHKVYGSPAYQYLEKNQELNQIFNKAMAHSGPLEMKRVLTLYKGFEGVSTLVDVGGGVGNALKQIISEYPSIKGINFDLPQVIQDAQPHPGIEHVEGSMFESVPTGDAILLKLVCHNWADEECVKFLKNCHKALPKHGKVIVLDYIIPEVSNPSNMSKHACAIDNLMFLVTTGKERTEEEFESLCKKSGFSKFHVACSEFSAMSGVMEFYK